MQQFVTIASAKICMTQIVFYANETCITIIEFAQKFSLLNMCRADSTQ